jgi:hypothetical protein
MIFQFDDDPVVCPPLPSPPPPEAGGYSKNRWDGPYIVLHQIQFLDRQAFSGTECVLKENSTNLMVSSFIPGGEGVSGGGGHTLESDSPGIDPAGGELFCDTVPLK